MMILHGFTCLYAISYFVTDKLLCLWTDPVYDACRVQVLDSAEHLVEQVGRALMIQVHLDHLAQVGVHQLHHQVHVLELLESALGRKRVQQANDL